MPLLTIATQTAALAPRRLFETSNDRPHGPLLPATTIVTLVCLVIVPAFIVTGVVIWLLAFYGRDKACCSCCSRERREWKRAAKRATGYPNDSGNISSNEEISMTTLPPMTAPPGTMVEVHPAYARMHSGGTGSTLGLVRETRTFV
jgi:hypothetical protein